VTLRFLLDTCIISSPISKTPDPGILAALEQHSDECAIAAPVWHELSYGSLRLPAGKRRRALERYLTDVVRASLPILPYDETAATWHAEERARLEAKGRPTPFVDGQIAAIARVHNLTLVTLDAKDFKDFKGLTVVTWSKRRGSRRR
jgi:tRNA(fMet)-specific endonuclease VapC